MPTAKPLAVIDTGVLTGPVAGSMAISVRVRIPEEVTVNAFASVIVSEPLTVTLRPPKAAPAAIFNVATAVPFGCTTTGPLAPAAAPPTEIPAPKFAVVSPEGNVVPEPVIVT
jgi:hypothetical protein